jgi:hypothetical protein
MTLTEYSIQSLRLDRRLRESSRISAYAVEALGIAKVMALVLLVSDLTPWSVANESPEGRMVFVIFFALGMAAVNLVRHPDAEATLDNLDRDAAS